MELGVYVPVRVWVGRSSGSYDAHSFPPSYPPQPARLAGGCTAPGLLAGDRTGPGDSGGTLAFTTLHGDAYALSGQDIRRWHQPRREFRTRITGGACRGVRAQEVHRRRGDRAVGILGVGEGSPRRTAPSPRSVAACRFARQVGNSPDTRMRSSSGDCHGRFADRGDIETIRDKFAKFASVRPECGPALPRRP